jgi:hypothetical protein
MRDLIATGRVTWKSAPHFLLRPTKLPAYINIPIQNPLNTFQDPIHILFENISPRACIQGSFYILWNLMAGEHQTVKLGIFRMDLLNKVYTIHMRGGRKHPQ